MMPCVTQQAKAGPVKVWLKGQGHGLHGGFSMLNTSECPNDAAVCSLSSILETDAIQSKYYLSQKACEGILRRAERSGKTLPELLEKALRIGAEDRTQA